MKPTSTNIKTHIIYAKKIDSPVFQHIQKWVVGNVQSDIYFKLLDPLYEQIRSNVEEKIRVALKNNLKNKSIIV